jgi:2-phosphoglycerate kinase
MTDSDDAHATAPFVILIGGCPGAGKTTLGRALAARLGVDSLTASDLRTAVRAMVPDATNADLWRIGRDGPVTYFSDTPPDRLVSDAVREHAAVWPAIAAVIEYRSRFGPSIVIDGWELVPELVHGLIGAADGGANGSVTAVWLDVAPAELQRRERTVMAFYAAAPDPERMLANFLHRSIAWNDLVCSEAEHLGMPVLEQDGSRTVEDLCDEVMALVGRS